MTFSPDCRQCKYWSYDMDMAPFCLHANAGPLGILGRTAHSIVSPVQRATSSIATPIGDWWSGVTDSGNLKRENRKLRAQITELQTTAAQAQAALAQDLLGGFVDRLLQHLGGNGGAVPRMAEEDRRSRKKVIV